MLRSKARCPRNSGPSWGWPPFPSPCFGAITDPGDFEGKSTLPETKKGYRKVVLTDEQMRVLGEYKEQNCPDAQPNDRVLPGKRGRPIDLGRLMSEHMKPLAHNLGIPELHWHALRHLNNSLMLNEGVDVKTRMDRLGHMQDRVNIIYSHAGDQAQ